LNRSAPFLLLALGVVVVSTASILVRLAQAEGASSAAIAWARAGAEIVGMSRRGLLLCAASGLLLALHFWTWIASLEHTSVASSAALVTTNPIWVAILSAWLLREAPARQQVVGIGLTLAGTALVFLADWSDAGMAPAPLLGNTLALTGALAASGYLLIGRSLRSDLGLLAYVWLAYAFAAVALLFAALAGGESVAKVPSGAWIFIAALAIGPQLIGHTVFNWALRRLSATFVALSILGEPVGSAILAWWLLDEGFSALQFAGFTVLLAGIFIAARAERGR
jgi:drug/metabolite transporter (DMT)-like permease